MLLLLHMGSSVVKVQGCCKADGVSLVPPRCGFQAPSACSDLRRARRESNWRPSAFWPAASPLDYRAPCAGCARRTSAHDRQAAAAATRDSHLPRRACARTASACPIAGWEKQVSATCHESLSDMIPDNGQVARSAFVCRLLGCMGKLRAARVAEQQVQQRWTCWGLSPGPPAC